MIEDVYEPLARYRDEFRDRFAELTQEKFRELTEASGVDVEANRKTVARIASLRRQAKSVRIRKFFVGLLMALGFLAAVGCGIAVSRYWQDDRRLATQLAVGAVAGLVVVFVCLSPFRRLKARLAELSAEIEQQIQLAWEQLEPLNQLYTWDITPRLIEATVPRLAFDPFFTARRLADLRRLYGWSDAFNDGKSVLFAQSGVINGNPFVFGEYVEMTWGTETYHGYKTIHWTEIEHDEKGRPRRVSRSETLHASVTKPKPEYGEHKVLIYGNDAAPKLSFTRRPSELSGAGNGFFSRWKRQRTIKRLERFSRNLDDDSNYTMMANKDFEAQFCTMDRTDEVEFRLLFTPLAQRQILQLLNDRSVGYGDDFTFRKAQKINLLWARHLDAVPIDTDPERFQDWDYDRAARNFQAFNEEYFKSVFFAMAPLLAIPLYQQTRTHEDIWKGVVPGEDSSFWEHEATANYHGEEEFRHPACITRSILKTSVVRDSDGSGRVAVTAHGFRGEKRTDYVEVYGGDGRYHSVPVEWTEYLPVSRTREMSVSESATPSEDFRQSYEGASAAVFRRSIYSYLVR